MPRQPPVHGSTWPQARRLTRARLARWPLPEHGDDCDKEGRGQVLVVAGSREIPGAALLAAVAALRAGAGKLAIATAESVAPGLALAVPEARVIALPELRAGGLSTRGVDRLERMAHKASAVVVGPGMVDEKATTAFTRAVLPLFAHSTVVLDAYAMSAAQARPFDTPVVLTPHAGEMAHLTGVPKQDIQAAPLAAANSAARQWNACVVLKGATTHIALPEGGCWRYDGGTPGLATSGSGDTLAGLIGGLAARGADLLPACAWGVVLHALAGEALARAHGPLGYLARELSGPVPGLIHALSPGR